MIYTDRMGHLISDSNIDELHQFADKMGLRREWFQNKPGRPHYDLTTPRARERAIEAGAVLIDPKVLVAKLRVYQDASLTEDFSVARAGTGTYEWAESTFNIQRGCPHGCLYCYACANALRRRIINDRDKWIRPVINSSAVEKGWRKNKGVIMFPSAHDITLDNLDVCIRVLTNMLRAGNRVLIVTKPHADCVQEMFENLGIFKQQILFRFTIGSLDPGICAFWEPGAPDPWERIYVLEQAYAKGFQTSVSMEPMLGGKESALQLFNVVKPVVTETIWIGKMNMIRQRVDLSIPLNREMVKGIELLQADEPILALVNRLKGEPKVRWKDSIRSVIQARARG